MILYFPVDVKKLFDLGKSYPWKRPRRCPVCKGTRLWGHGYAERYFEGFSEALWVKRYLCPECGAVHSTRPRDYLKGFRHRSSVILGALADKLFGSGRWSSGVPRQNQQYWLRAAIRRLSVSSNTALPTLSALKGLFLPPPSFELRIE